MKKKIVLICFAFIICLAGNPAGNVCATMSDKTEEIKDDGTQIPEEDDSVQVEEPTGAGGTGGQTSGGTTGGQTSGGTAGGRALALAAAMGQEIQADSRVRATVCLLPLLPRIFGIQKES